MIFGVKDINHFCLTHGRYEIDNRNRCYGSDEFHR